ncbi:hypothetical protein Y032_0010g907 [Ancylostoma ceylanicum]|uniref:Major facilitator superfamily (MFS) profile domain-containing protein n=1 Tax=Ancylostoma ceylanicum TaxID=53326 RepID=A0A016VGZ0_9BILA|nr:hypothetical protein Y032_0010g907 [Ancylostoma ceylanicum]
MRQDLLVILQLGFAFFTVFSAFNSQGFVEITVLRGISQHDPSSGITSNSGYYSLAIIYFVFTVCNLIAPPIISVLGSKWAQVLGAVCYTSFMIQFLFVNYWLLYVFSAVLGFGAAVIWTANGAYLVQFSRAGKMARNSGILWAMLQSSLVAGAIFLFFVLSYGDLYSSYRFLYTAFTVISCVGIVTLCLLPAAPPLNLDESVEDPLFDDNTDELDVSAPIAPQVSRSWQDEFKHTFSLLRTKDMVLLSICFLYSGIETSFYTGVYTACLSAATALNMGSERIISYAVLAMGAGQISGGLLFGVFPRSNALNRSQIVILGMILHILAFFLCFLNLPMEAPLHKTSSIGYIEPSVFVAILTGYFLGLADSCWNTQIYTLIGAMYKNESSCAFALFKFFQSLAACASFYYSSVLLLHWQLLALCLGSAVAAVCFFTVANKAEVTEVYD